MTRPHSLPEELDRPVAVSLDLYTIRNPDDRIRTYHYPVLSKDVPREYVEDMLAVVRLELVRAEDELSDVRDQRRKVRDICYGSMAAVSASLIAMLTQSGKPWQVVWPYWAAFVLAVVAQLWAPLVTLDDLGKDESAHRRDVWALRKIEAEYEQVWRRLDRRDKGHGAERG